jgi:hypothetical protein
MLRTFSLTNSVVDKEYHPVTPDNWPDYTVILSKFYNSSAKFWQISVCIDGVYLCCPVRACATHDLIFTTHGFYSNNERWILKIDQGGRPIEADCYEMTPTQDKIYFVNKMPVNVPQTRLHFVINNRTVETEKTKTIRYTEHWYEVTLQELENDDKYWLVAEMDGYYGGELNLVKERVLGELIVQTDRGFCQWVDATLQPMLKIGDQSA